MPALMVSGCGNIGSRLLQSLSNLTSGPYDIYGIEPYEANWAIVRERFDAENKGGHTLHMMTTPAGLPESVDLLIVSVDARNRLTALKTALGATTPKAVLLEKILFTQPEDFAQAQALIDDIGAPCWVNCSRNIWPGYQALKAELDAADMPLQHYEASGSDWHLCSNSIHFLSAVEFLADSPITKIELEDGATQRDAKRAGYKEIVGTLTGHTKSGATFRVASLPEQGQPIIVTIKAGDKERRILEGKTIAVNGEEQAFPMLYTSQLDGPLSELILDHKSDLPELANSTNLHLQLFSVLNSVFYPNDPNASEKECPIT